MTSERTTRASLMSGTSTNVRFQTTGSRNGEPHLLPRIVLARRKMRHGRPCGGHPRLWIGKQDADGGTTSPAMTRIEIMPTDPETGSCNYVMVRLGRTISLDKKISVHHAEADRPAEPDDDEWWRLLCRPFGWLV